MIVAAASCPSRPPLHPPAMGSDDPVGVFCLVARWVAQVGRP